MAIKRYRKYMPFPAKDHPDSCNTVIITLLRYPSVDQDSTMKILVTANNFFLKAACPGLFSFISNAQCQKKSWVCSNVFKESSYRIQLLEDTVHSHLF